MDTHHKTHTQTNTLKLYVNKHILLPASCIYSPIYTFFRISAELYVILYIMYKDTPTFIDSMTHIYFTLTQTQPGNASVTSHRSK